MNPKDLVTLFNPSRQAYAQKINAWLAAFPFGVWWPTDDTSGTALRAVSQTANLSGTYTGAIDLANTTGPSGSKIAHSGGSNIYGNLLTAALQTAWTAGARAEGGHGGWYKADANAWTDGVGTVFQWLITDGANIEYAAKNVDSSLCGVINRGGTNLVSVIPHFYPSGWFHYFVTWSDSHSRVRVFLNGELYQEFTAGVWAGGLAGALLYSSDGVTSWKGCDDTHVLVGGREPTPGEVHALATAAAPIARLSVLGDSITAAWADHSDWSWQVGYTWRSSLAICINHAEATMGILTGAHNLAYQAAAAAGDDADAIIVALGINDNDGGDMSALQTAYQAGLAALRASNRRAALYALNVWPICNGGTAANLRPAIAAACAAQSVTCLDPVSTPWFLDGDTSDHLHPTAAGHAKIATQVLSRLT
jgi:lysophospholipase L1-like esterase